MALHIVVIQGHPDSRGNHFCHALAEAYMRGAAEAGHEVRLIDVARLDFPLLRTKEEFECGPVPEVIRQAQESVGWAQHLVFVHPLWLGGAPALLKGFLEQVFRPSFVFRADRARKFPQRLLSGRSACVVVTMGMPAIVYRWYFGAHGSKSLERSILSFSGISPVRTTLIGMIEAPDRSRHAKWLERMQAMGRKGR